jgi:hypothetical protein
MINHEAKLSVFTNILQSQEPRFRLVQNFVNKGIKDKAKTKTKGTSIKFCEIEGKLRGLVTIFARFEA